jgi:hypothetical protein
LAEVIINVPKKICLYRSVTWGITVLDMRRTLIVML